MVHLAAFMLGAGEKVQSWLDNDSAMVFQTKEMESQKMRLCVRNSSMNRRKPGGVGKKGNHVEDPQC